MIMRIKGKMLRLYQTNLSICLKNTDPKDPKNDNKERMGEGE